MKMLTTEETERLKKGEVEFRYSLSYLNRRVIFNYVVGFTGAMFSLVLALTLSILGIAKFEGMSLGLGLLAAITGVLVSLLAGATVSHTLASARLNRYVQIRKLREDRIKNMMNTGEGI